MLVGRDAGDDRPVAGGRDRLHLARQDPGVDQHHTVVGPDHTGVRLPVATRRDGDPIGDLTHAQGRSSPATSGAARDRVEELLARGPDVRVPAERRQPAAEVRRLVQDLHDRVLAPVVQPTTMRERRTVVDGLARIRPASLGAGDVVAEEDDAAGLEPAGEPVPELIESLGQDVRDQEREEDQVESLVREAAPIRRDLHARTRPERPRHVRG